MMSTDLADIERPHSSVERCFRLDSHLMLKPVV